jgi:hypothetical protein
MRFGSTCIITFIFAISVRCMCSWINLARLIFYPRFIAVSLKMGLGCSRSCSSCFGCFDCFDYYNLVSYNLSIQKMQANSIDF